MTASIAQPDRAQLAHLLSEAGARLDPDGVKALIAGVLAAPPEIGSEWHKLVADPTPPALAEALEATRRYLAEDYRDGLGGEDFARLPRAARLALLREELKARRLDGFIVPRADEHQGEYVPSCGQRLAWLQRRGDPFARGLLDKMTPGEKRGVHFRLRLKRVASIDEDRRLLRQDDGEARRSGEAGKPSEPLSAHRDVLALVLVGARHEKAVDAALPQRGAQPRQPLRCWHRRATRRPGDLLGERQELRLEPR